MTHPLSERLREAIIGYEFERSGNDETNIVCELWPEDADAIIKRIKWDEALDDAKKKLLVEAMEALQPFAKAAECAENDEGDGYGLDRSSARYELNLGNLRKARVILSSIGGSE